VSGFYTDGKEQLLARTIPVDAGVFVVGVNDTYAFDPTHVDFTPITQYILLPEKQLTAVTFTGGILDADDVQWLAAGAGVVDRSLILAGVIIYFQKDAVGTLLTYINSSAVGLPQTLDGSNVTAKWDSRGILKL
jgi:hypothetical protein